MQKLVITAGFDSIHSEDGAKRSVKKSSRTRARLMQLGVWFIHRVSNHQCAEMQMQLWLAPNARICATSIPALCIPDCASLLCASLIVHPCLCTPAACVPALCILALHIHLCIPAAGTSAACIPVCAPPLHGSLLRASLFVHPCCKHPCFMHPYCEHPCCMHPSVQSSDAS